MMGPSMPTAYQIRCPCGAVNPDDGALGCATCGGPGLVRTEYACRRLAPRGTEDGVFRFGDWLPLRSPFAHEGLPGVYRSDALGNALGLDAVWVAFSGWWPERGATLRTATFKDLEAPVVFARLGDDPRVLVVASAGNTARAFAEAASTNERPLVLVVPAGAEPLVWSTRPFAPTVRLVVVDGGDYLDAIEVADAIARLPGFVAEGGSRNVGRRDGLGTPILAATLAMGRLPRHYVQAVGSGAGGIAAWEAALRLRADGRFGDAPMRLHLAQNAPFAPMADAWSRRSRDLAALDPADAAARIDRIGARVLSNRRPPYAVPGGVFDALADTDGRTYAISTAVAARAGAWFSALEGVDVDPAAAVAVAALRQAAATGAIAADEPVLLHVTGGGEARLRGGRPVHTLAPSVRLRRGEPFDPRLGDLADRA
jgi:cysteate synthase